MTQSLRLWPSQFEGQAVIDWSVDIEGAVRGAGLRTGAGDWIETSTILGPVTDVIVAVSGVVETTDLSGVLRGHRERVPPGAYLRDTRFTRPDSALTKLAKDAVSGTSTPLEQAHALANAVRDAILLREILGPPVALRGRHRPGNW